MYGSTAYNTDEYRNQITDRREHEAAAKYYYKCSDCLAVVCIIGRQACPICGICGGGMREMGEVRGAQSEHHHSECVCNEACVSAQGPDCSCSCGGVNHGIGMMGYYDVVDATGTVKITAPRNAEKHLAQAQEYRAAADAATARIQARYGDDCGRFARREWIADKAIWSRINNDLADLHNAKLGKLHKSRVNKLDMICR